MSANLIKSTISMRDIADKYSLEVNRSGFMCCPFHNERTPSLKIYKEASRGFYCYGCGEGGTVIDFVMKLFQINFSQAIVRIGSDFGLNVSNKRPNNRELLKLKKDRAERKQKEDEENEFINQCITLYRFYFFISKNYSPKKMGKIIPEWEEAVNRMDYILYLIEKR